MRPWKRGKRGCGVSSSRVRNDKRNAQRGTLLLENGRKVPEYEQGPFKHTETDPEDSLAVRISSLNTDIRRVEQMNHETSKRPMTERLGRAPGRDPIVSERHISHRESTTGRKRFRSRSRSGERHRDGVSNGKYRKESRIRGNGRGRGDYEERLRDDRLVDDRLRCDRTNETNSRRDDTTRDPYVNETERLDDNRSPNISPTRYLGVAEYRHDFSSPRQTIEFAEEDPRIYSYGRIHERRSPGLSSWSPERSDRHLRQMSDYNSSPETLPQIYRYNDDSPRMSARQLYDRGSSFDRNNDDNDFNTINEDRKRQHSWRDEKPLAHLKLERCTQETTSSQEDVIYSRRAYGSGISQSTNYFPDDEDRRVADEDWNRYTDSRTERGPPLSKDKPGEYWKRYPNSSTEVGLPRSRVIPGEDLNRYPNSRTEVRPPCTRDEYDRGHDGSNRDEENTDQRSVFEPLPIDHDTSLAEQLKSSEFEENVAAEIMRIVIMNMHTNRDITISSLLTHLKEKARVQFSTPKELAAFLKRQGKFFEIKKYHDGAIALPKTDIEVCQDYVKKTMATKSSCNGSCQALHICKFHLFDTCSKQNACNLEHDLYSDHNMSVLRQARLHRTGPVYIKLLVSQPRNRNLTTLPVVCKFYNNQTKCNKDACPHLHICRHVITNNCKFGYFCIRNHSLNNQQCIRILERFGLRYSTDRDTQLRQLLEKTLSSKPVLNSRYFHSKQLSSGDNKENAVFKSRAEKIRKEMEIVEEKIKKKKDATKKGEKTETVTSVENNTIASATAQTTLPDSPRCRPTPLDLHQILPKCELPAYTPVSPRYSPVSSANSSESPSNRSESPVDSPRSPTYSPNSPSYRPMSPFVLPTSRCTSPSNKPTSPSYMQISPTGPDKLPASSNQSTSTTVDQLPGNIEVSKAAGFSTIPSTRPVSTTTSESNIEISLISDSASRGNMFSAKNVTPVCKATMQSSLEDTTGSLDTRKTSKTTFSDSTDSLDKLNNHQEEQFVSKSMPDQTEELQKESESPETIEKQFAPIYVQSDAFTRECQMSTETERKVEEPEKPLNISDTLGGNKVQVNNDKHAMKEDTEKGVCSDKTLLESNSSLCSATNDITKYPDDSLRMNIEIETDATKVTNVFGKPLMPAEREPENIDGVENDVIDENYSSTNLQNLGDTCEKMEMNGQPIVMLEDSSAKSTQFCKSNKESKNAVSIESFPIGDVSEAGTELTVTEHPETSTCLETIENVDNSEIATENQTRNQTEEKNCLEQFTAIQTHAAEDTCIAGTVDQSNESVNDMLENVICQVQIRNEDISGFGSQDQVCKNTEGNETQLNAVSITNCQTKYASETGEQDQVCKRQAVIEQAEKGETVKLPKNSVIDEKMDTFNEDLVESTGHEQPAHSMRPDSIMKVCHGGTETIFTHENGQWHISVNGGERKQPIDGKIVDMVSKAYEFLQKTSSYFLEGSDTSNAASLATA